MLKKTTVGMAVFFLSIGLCCAQLSRADTIVNFQAIGALTDVASFNFTIVSPTEASVANFSPTLPDGWFNLSSGDIVSAFDSTGTASLPTATLGSFDLDVTLGDWVFGNQAGVSLTEGEDYVVRYDGTNHTVTSVPIPSAVLLLGSGIFGLVAWRRRSS